MKKILLIIICFFTFSPSVLALSKVNRMEVSINIDEEGVASITEEWQISAQNNNYFEKIFYDAKDIIISDVVVTDSLESSYIYEKNFNKNRSLIYNYQDKNKTKKIRISTNNKDTTLRIDYKVNGIITKYDDLYAINWNILSSTPSLEIGILNVYVSGPLEFSETNTALYGIGDVSCEFEEGKIHIFTSNIVAKEKIRLMASITGYDFNDYLTISGTFQENYEEYKARTPFHAYIEQVLDNLLVTISIALTIIFVISFIVYKLIKKDKVSRDFKSIKSYKKSRTVGELASVPYVDEVPCEYNLYKMYFIANYYSIIKHRSSLIGAILFKWILEGLISIESDDEKFYIRLSENVTFANSLDQELYQLLLASSNNLILENNKLTRYAEENSSLFISWYDKVVAEVIKDEYNKRNISVKGSKIILNKIIFNEAIKIQGFKKYLLNFNQVPRKTELTEEAYKYSLISSVLLRVDENFYKELLRKNPSNDGAHTLERFSKVKYLYSNIYSKCIEAFEKDKHNKRKKNRYNPEKN